MYTRILLFLCLIFIMQTDILSQTVKTSVRGFVKNIKTNEMISGAVILCDSSVAAITDSSGFFKFLLSSGKYKIQCRYIGYETGFREIILDKVENKKEIFFYLLPRPIETEKVTITGKRYKELENFKTYELKSGDISNIPIPFEPDALKAVQVLPGVTTFHDLSSLIYLRGGNFDETLITIDEVPAYNLTHLGGLFGSVNPDIVDMEILYPSNYPVSYQGALSGILSIYTKNGNIERTKGSASIGLVSSKLFLEGPLLKGNFTFSARRTYPELLYNLISKYPFPYYFYDLSGKYSIALNNKNLVSVSGFYSRDIYKLFVEKGEYVLEKKEDINWGNKIVSAAYNHFFDNGILKMNLYYSASGFAADATGFHNLIGCVVVDTLETLEHYKINNQIKNISANTEIEYRLEGQEITVGLEYQKLMADYFWYIKETNVAGLVEGKFAEIFFDFAPDKVNVTDKTDIVSLYFEDRLQLTSKFSLNLGYRSLYLNKINKYLNSPFLLANYDLNQNTKISLGYGRYYEYFHTKREYIRNSILTPFAVYFISDNADNIPESDHFTVGLKVNELLPDIRLEAEGYYKSRHNIVASDKLTKTTSYTDGYSFGIDLLIKKEIGEVTGQVVYSFSRSIKKGMKYSYFADYDRSHNVKLLMNYNLSDRWELNAFWNYSSGLPFTPVVGKFVTGDNEDPINIIYGKKNTCRYRDFHRLDIGIKGNFLWGKLIAKPYLQVLNVYNSSNPFNYDPVPNDLSLEEGTERGSLVIPTIGLTVEF